MLPQVTWLRIATGATLVAGLALTGPLLWSAAAAGAGLLLLGGLGLLGAGVLRMLPLMGQRLENRLLAARKAEARKNPLEQLENFLLARGAQVAAFKEQVASVGAQLRSLEDLLADRRRDKPTMDLVRQEQSLSEMQRGLALLVTRYLDAERALEELAGVIDDKRFEWRFSRAGQAALQCLGSANGEELLDQMLADEAFASVRDNFNRVFAELEVEARRLESNQVALARDDGGPRAVEAFLAGLPPPSTGRGRP